MNDLSQAMTPRTANPFTRAFAIMFLVVCTAVSAVGQTTHTETVSGLRVTMGFDKTEIAVGDPLLLKIEMENISGMPVLELATNFQFAETNNLEVMVQPAGELPYQYLGAVTPGTYADTPLLLVAGQPIIMDNLLLYDRSQPSGFLFSKPGTYALGVTFKFRSRNNPTKLQVSMPPVQIQVTPAEGAARQAFELLDEPELVRMLHLASPTTDSLAIIENASQRYPGTTLGALALRATARFYAVNTDPSYREKGAKLLQDYLANGLIFGDADLAILDIATAYHLNENFDLARQWIFYLIRNQPNSIRVGPQNALLYYYFFQPAEFASSIPWYLLKQPWVVPGVQPPTNLSPRQID